MKVHYGYLHNHSQSSSRNRINLKRTVGFFIVTLFSGTFILLNYILFSGKALLYNRSIKNQQPPIPGKFLWNFPINDASYCNFNYGLPGRLNYTENDLQYPPQEGIVSSYRVLYNAIEADQDMKVPKVTYVTHITVDYVLFIPEIARHWDGPISIAAFVPAQDASIFFDNVFQLCFCMTEMSRVSIHLVFPLDYEPKLEENTNFSTRFQDCRLKTEFTDKFDRVGKGLLYPINVGRNVAREAAATHFVMVSDIELIPSSQLAKKFMYLMNIYRKLETWQVFVVPTFEIEYDNQLPLTKKDLLSLIKMGLAVYFHRFLCPHCQKFPGIDAWLEKYEENDFRPFLSVKREYPFHRWEPIFIGTKEEPYYDEGLSWEGLQDKMPQMLQLCLLNYTFIILDGAFLVHWPGIKKKPHKGSDAWRTPYIKKNAEEYGRIIREMSKVPEYTRKKQCRLQ